MRLYRQANQMMGMASTTPIVELCKKFVERINIIILLLNDKFKDPNEIENLVHRASHANSQLINDFAQET